MPTALQSLEAALAAFTAPRAPKPAPRPVEAPKAPGFHKGLNAFYRPADEVAYLADRLEADGVVIVRENGMIRTRNAAERAADALKMAAE